MRRMTKQEKEWQAESDARTLTRYGDLIANTERFSAAKKWLEDEKANMQRAIEAANRTTVI